jgi:hypothetical protein
MKNPFLVYKEFLSPLQCEDIIYGNNNTFPNVDKHGKIQPLRSKNLLSEVRIAPLLADLVVPDIETHYDVEVKGIKQFIMEWYPGGYDGGEKPRCENSAYIGGKWQRINDNDFTGVLFLNEYQDVHPFDDSFEVRGGQLEFPTHNFGFNPRRGTLIIFPGAANFMNHTAAIDAGELTQIRFHVATHEYFMYDMQQFKGTHETWFKGEDL